MKTQSSGYYEDFQDFYTITLACLGLPFSSQFWQIIHHKIIETGIVGEHAAAQAVIHAGAPAPPVATEQAVEQIAKQERYITPGATTPGILESAKKTIAGIAILLSFLAILGIKLEYLPELPTSELSMPYLANVFWVLRLNAWIAILSSP